MNPDEKDKNKELTDLIYKLDNNGIFSDPSNDITIKKLYTDLISTIAKQTHLIKDDITKSDNRLEIEDEGGTLDSTAFSEQKILSKEEMRKLIKQNIDLRSTNNSYVIQIHYKKSMTIPLVYTFKSESNNPDDIINQMIELENYQYFICWLVPKLYNKPTKQEIDDIIKETDWIKEAEKISNSLGNRFC